MNKKTDGGYTVYLRMCESIKQMNRGWKDGWMDRWMAIRLNKWLNKQTK